MRPLNRRKVWPSEWLKTKTYTHCEYFTKPFHFTNFKFTSSEVKHCNRKLGLDFGCSLKSRESGLKPARGCWPLSPRWAWGRLNTTSLQSLQDTYFFLFYSSSRHIMLSANTIYCIYSWLASIHCVVKFISESPFNNSDTLSLTNSIRNKSLPFKVSGKMSLAMTFLSSWCLLDLSDSTDFLALIW